MVVKPEFGVVTQNAGLRDRVLASYSGLRVTWFDGWHPALEEALQSLPEMETCPHELFRLLVQNPGPARKRAALVSEKGVPVAVVGLRQRGHYSWEPVTQWIVPGAIFPAQPGYLVRALEALGRDLWVAWWRMGGPPPFSPLIRSMESMPTHRMHSCQDFEQYWRETSHFKTVRRVRNRCRDLTLAINKPGAAAWTIRNWQSTWLDHPTSADPGLSDRILVAEYLERHGRHFTLSLLDGDRLAGSATLTVQHRDLVAGVLYREPEYDPYGIGNRLVDLSFCFAAEHGYETLDIGGGHDYKKHWAPQEGERWWFNISPEPLFWMKRTVQWASKLRKRSGVVVEQ
jgi:hypothetical protein